MGEFQAHQEIDAEWSKMAADTL